MPRLAIVISAIGTTESLESTLVSVLENRPTDSEILVVLKQPYTDPYQLDGEVRFVHAAARDGWTASVNDALRTTRAPFVHLLAAGCTVTDGWADAALVRFGDKQIAAVAPLVMDAARRERIFAAGVGYKSSGRRYLVARGQTQLASDVQAHVLGACFFAGFFRKTALELAGGLCPQLGPSQADADLAVTLSRAGLRVAVEPKSRVLAGPEADDDGLGPFRRALYEERLFWRNPTGSGRASALAAHAGLVALEMLTSLPRPRVLAQLAARTLACCQIGSYVRRRAQLAQLGGSGTIPHRPGLRVDRTHAGPSAAQSSGARAASR